MCSLTRVGPEVHFQTGLSFKFFLANLTLMHSGFIPVNKVLMNSRKQEHGGQLRETPPLLHHQQQHEVENILLPHFLPQMNALVVDRQVVVAPEALATFFTLVRLLTWNKHGWSLKYRLETVNGLHAVAKCVNEAKEDASNCRSSYRSVFSDAWSGDHGV